MTSNRVTKLIRKVFLTLRQCSSDYGTYEVQGLAAGEMEATGRIVAAIILSESKGD